MVDAYVNYAKTAFALFGDWVQFWATFNEPIVPVEGGYFYKFHLPCISDGKRAANVAYHTQVASSRAIKTFHEMQADSSVLQSAKIGIILNLTPTYPRSEDNEQDVAATNACDLMFNRSFLDPSVIGTYPQELIAMAKEPKILPDVSAEELECIAQNTVDFLGVNYYQPRRAKAREDAGATRAALTGSKFVPERYFEPYRMPGAKMNPYRGWEIYEKGIYDIATNLRENYGNIPFYISENGMGVEGEETHMDATGKVHDMYRIEFIKEHLKWLHRAIQEGSNCFGYHMWTFIDCWSWTNAYKNRYGFIGLDLETQKRTVKESGEWFKQVSENC